jgi:LuxR family maltose regulon positive regulatory protein
LVEPLTPRELEILHLIAAGYTNPEIADEFVLALGTVKWYASQIYGKLGVKNRTEAAVRARESGLLA